MKIFELTKPLMESIIYNQYLHVRKLDIQSIFRNELLKERLKDAMKIMYLPNLHHNVK